MPSELLDYKIQLFEILDFNNLKESWNHFMIVMSTYLVQIEHNQKIETFNSEMINLDQTCAALSSTHIMGDMIMSVFLPAFFFDEKINMEDYNFSHFYFRLSECDLPRSCKYKIVLLGSSYEFVPVKMIDGPSFTQFDIVTHLLLRTPTYSPPDECFSELLDELASVENAKMVMYHFEGQEFQQIHCLEYNDYCVGVTDKVAQYATPLLAMFQKLRKMASVVEISSPSVKRKHCTHSPANFAKRGGAGVSLQCEFNIEQIEDPIQRDKHDKLQNGDFTLLTSSSTTGDVTLFDDVSVDEFEFDFDGFEDEEDGFCLSDFSRNLESSLENCSLTSRSMIMESTSGMSFADSPSLSDFTFNPI